MNISGRITELKNLGKSFEEIKNQLVSEGYAEPDIIIGINNYTQSPQTQTPVPPVLPVPQTENQKGTSDTISTNPFSYKFRTWYDWAGIIPFIVLLVQGGLLGGAAGVVGWVYAFKQLHVPERSPVKKAGMYMLILVATWIIYFVLAALFLYAMEAFFGLSSEG